MPVFERTVTIEAPAEIAYHWHEMPGAFERMIPPWVRARIGKNDPAIADGSKTCIEIRLLEVWRKWVVAHENVVAGSQFTDRQIFGPFKKWRHCHYFKDTSDGQCELIDRVEFELPIGGIGSSYAKKELERVFAYRHEVAKRDIERFAARASRPVFGVTGSTGFIGKKLSDYLRSQGCKVIGITRHPRSDQDIAWNPERGELDAERLEGIDVLVNLAGANVASGKWTEARKRKLRDSRIESLVTLKSAIGGMRRRPYLLISASGIGFYGKNRESLTGEEAVAGKGFLAELCVEWEAAAKEIRPLLDRVVIARTGLVLGASGGALRKMLPAFSFGFGGRLGSGRQWMSWIGIEDWIRAIDFISDSPDAEGVFNMCVEDSVENTEFTKTLGKILKRPAIFPVPEFLLKLAFGEMTEEMLLSSSRAIPERLVDCGFEFAHPDLEQSLRFSLGK